MFKSMIDKVKQSVASARTALAAKKQEHESAEQILAGEIPILERHSNLVERLAVAQKGFVDFGAVLKERYDRDFVPTLAAQIATDSTRLDMLAGQFAAIETIKANLPRLLVEFKKCTVEAHQADLVAFELEHGAILKKHGAIGQY